MDKGVLITLKDIDSNKTYTTLVSPKDAHRVKTDIVFASQLLSALKRSQGESNLLNSIQEESSSSNSIQGESSSSNSMALMASTSNAEIPESEQDSVFKWPHRAVLLLIEEYRKREEDITSGKMSQRRAWNSISEVLCSHGYDVTGPQCQSKFNGMKRTYKSIKDHNSKSGNNPLGLTLK
ncbi:hypothetical protein ALC57_08791 [Trachymyrmex cornetzi]|uniref:Myb/SANT-like DNA-binding domain-containing protein n=1 Tax=Trachymyrmex cornetzi TaxID=471704 RepID=A0A151J6Q4_9HYME|nr:hypothetical protein ALC57_08791 [Trachymyrmex cornetzi]